MPNLYIHFESIEDRRAFLLEILEIPEILPRNNSPKARQEAARRQKQLDAYIARLEAGKTSSPYYNLHKRIHGARIPRNMDTDGLEPWNELAVYAKGFRQIYAQNSYRKRPGKWLVVQFRDNYTGWRRYEWLLRRVPDDKLGASTPAPLLVSLRRKLEQARHILGTAGGGRLKAAELNLALGLLQSVKTRNPRLFRGDNLYLWEELAFAYLEHNNLQKAEHCLREMAGLMPGSSEPYINLGAFFISAGMINWAIKAYKEGLAVNPKDERLYFNLASLYAGIGAYSKADAMMNKAIFSNPDRGINYMFRADLAMERGHYEAAVQNYRHALGLLTGEPWQEIRKSCYMQMAVALMRLERYEECAEAASELLAINPDFRDAYVLLARCCRELGNHDLAKWYAKKAEQLYRRLRDHVNS